MPQVSGYSSPMYPATGQADARVGTQGEVSFDDLRQGEEAVRRQIAALRNVASSIYGAAKSMEDERTE